MNGGYLLRFKYISGRYSRVLVAGLLVVSLTAFSAAAIEATAPPETRTVTDQTDTQTVQTSLSSEARVTESNALYDRDTTLTDMPVYLLGATPNVTLVATTDVPADRSVTVSQQIHLELSATKGDEVFWTERRTVAATTQQVTNGTAQTAVTLDVRRLARERISEVDAAAGDVGTIRAQVYVDATYDTGTYTGRTNVSSPLAITERAYELDTPRTTQRNHAKSVTRTVNATTAGHRIEVMGTVLTIPDSVVGWSGTGVAAFVASLTVWLTARRIDDFEAFQRYYETVRFTEWISRGKLPQTDEYARIPVESLADLVDVAIDSENRVIYDEAQNTYAVVEESLVYEFREDDERDGLYEFGLAPVDSPSESLEEGLFDDGAPITDGGEDDV